MPIFVWWAIAIAIVLLGGGGAVKLGFSPITDTVSEISKTMDSPFGYILSIGIVILIIGATIYKIRVKKQNETKPNSSVNIA